MKRLLKIFAFSLLVSQNCWATGDSLRYLTTEDTLLLEIDRRGRKLFKHQLERGQTLYSLAKFYGLTLGMVYDNNPGLQEKSLAVGTSITVPIPNRAIIRTLGSAAEKRKHIPIYYQVKSGDTLFGIARRAFRMDENIIRRRNGITGNNLTVGQWLHVGWMKPQPIPPDWQQLNGIPADILAENEYNRKTFLRKYFGKKTGMDKGKARWNNRGAMQLHGLYCLYSKAPVGSVVRLENPITLNVCYAKVVGAVPMNYETNVMAVVSADVARALGAIDQQLFIKVEYVSP